VPVGPGLLSRHELFEQQRLADAAQAEERHMRRPADAELVQVVAQLLELPFAVDELSLKLGRIEVEGHRVPHDEVSKACSRSSLRLIELSITSEGSRRASAGRACPGRQARDSSSQKTLLGMTCRWTAFLSAVAPPAA
jgi:hypothetical protein